MPLEKYVRSIAEVDYDWAMPGSAAYAPEAVKAQAVAARTYAVAKNGPLADNQNDQCYRGYTFEAKYPGIAQAAEETAGLILSYQGKPITAYFSAHSGGYTTDAPGRAPASAYIAGPARSLEPQGAADQHEFRRPRLELDLHHLRRPTSPQGQRQPHRQLDQEDGRRGPAHPGGDHRPRHRRSREPRQDPASHRREGTATVSASSFRALFGYSVMRSTLILSITGGEPLAPGEFYDVGPGHLYHDQIARMVTAGLMSGYDNGLFKPDGSVTRWQFAKIAVNLYNIMHPDDQIAVVNVTDAPFADVPVKPEETGDVSDWVAAAKKAGLVTGVTSTSFQPYTVVRRDQMATMMCRALGWEDEAAALPADTPGFADVPPTSPHWAAATYLKQQGIIQGYSGPPAGGADGAAGGRGHQAPARGRHPLPGARSSALTGLRTLRGSRRKAEAPAGGHTCLVRRPGPRLAMRGASRT